MTRIATAKKPASSKVVSLDSKAASLDSKAVSLDSKAVSRDRKTVQVSRTSRMASRNSKAARQIPAKSAAKTQTRATTPRQTQRAIARTE